jgi:predicted ATP-dependent endonuclease of OLD family
MMLSGIRQAANGIAIVEEPENHLHPGYQHLFVEQILSMSRKHNIQIFMTSHSYDLVEELANQSKRSGSVQISRMTKNEEAHEIHNYSSKDALEVMTKLKIDLRGF